MTKRNDDVFSLRQLSIEREQARRDVRENIAQTKERIQPANLMQDVKNKAIGKAVETTDNTMALAKRNPGKIASIAAVATLFAFRKPLAKYIRQMGSEAEPYDPPDLKE